MNWALLAVGRIKRGFSADGTAEYLKRAGRFRRIELIEVPAARGRPPQQAKEHESGAVLQRVRDDDHVILLDVDGKARSSEALAEHLAALEHHVRGRLVFVIGGAYGMDDAVRARADEALSLGAMTLPHELARLVLAEQIYRVLTIQKNLPYHHGG